MKQVGVVTNDVTAVVVQRKACLTVRQLADIPSCLTATLSRGTGNRTAEAAAVVVKGEACRTTALLGEMALDLLGLCQTAV